MDVRPAYRLHFLLLADCRVSLPFTFLVLEPGRCCPTPLGSLTSRSTFPVQDVFGPSKEGAC